MIKKIFGTGILIGIMDGIAACINNYIFFNVWPGAIFKYIASGIYGVDAFSSDIKMIFMGLLLHFFIAIIVTAIFFGAYNKLSFLQHKYWLYGAIYGVLVWGIMNYVIIPLSKISSTGLSNIQIFTGLLIHILIIGIPISYFANQSLSSDI